MDQSDTDVSSLTTLRLSEYSAPTATGRCLLAQFTDREVVVYQAYNPAIGAYALEHQHFGGGFSFTRTSWIKPNFTWMMHRCGWASKQNQEVVLALSLRRDFWDSVLSKAVMSNYGAHLSTLGPGEASAIGDARRGSAAASGGVQESRGGRQSRWKAALRASDVVMQWDPDHRPFTGHKTNHRVIQLGLRGDVLAAFRGPAFGGEGGIQDITAFVKATKDMHCDRPVIGQGGAPAIALPPMMLPVEEPYLVGDAHVAQRLGVD
ncbi:unnamed protein product [Scytosiphon promiscuus]